MANEFEGAYFQTKQEITEAYLFLRKNNMTIPSETLELMKDAAIKELDCALANAETRESNCNIPLVSESASDAFDRGFTAGYNAGVKMGMHSR